MRPGTTHDRQRTPSAQPAATAALPEHVTPRGATQLSAIMQRAAADPRALTRADAAALQRTLGNAAVGRLLVEGAPRENNTGRRHGNASQSVDAASAAADLEAPEPASEPRAVMQRKIGFEFETGWLVRKKTGRWPFTKRTPLNKKDRVVARPDFRVEADEAYGGDSELEFIVDPPVEETKDGYEALERAMTGIEDVASTLELVSARNKKQPFVLNVPNQAAADLEIKPTKAGKLQANPQATTGLDLGRMHQLGDLKEMPSQLRILAPSLAEHAAKLTQGVHKGISPQLRGLLVVIAKYLETGASKHVLNYPKRIADAALLARTDFAELFRLLPPAEQARFAPLHSDAKDVAQEKAKNWIDLVIGAVDSDTKIDPDERLFKGGVREEIGGKDVTPALTVKDWLLGMLNNVDRLTQIKNPEGMGEFRDRTEKVGPAGHQTEAGIFEFRRLNTGPLVLHEWRPFATSFYEYIVALHAAPAEHANGDEKPVQLAKDEKTGYVGAATAAGPPAAAAPAQKAQRNDVHAALDGQPAATLPRAEITGLPDRLKAGVENLSGLSMDDVRVHYNSPQPAAVQALAYTQGTDIHLAPGQQKHLPHEAWHVVQQKQGRVKPTLQMKGVAINDDTGLELEAEAMAGRALQTKPPLDRGKLPLRVPSTGVVNRFGAWVGRAPVQRKVGFEIEVENIGVERGILKEKSREVEEQFLDSEGRPIQDASVLESSPKEPLLEIRSAKDKPIEKGDTIFKGQGWRLTPDGEPKKWYGEFITDPIDETKDSKSISAVLESITDYALAIDGLKSEAYYNKGLANQYIIQRGPQKFSGNFHTTGGIRIDQIVDLLEQARIMLKKIKPDRDEKDEESADVETKKTSPPAAKLVPTKKDASGNYRGLVALVSNYIIAQRGTSRAPGYAKEFLPVMSRTNLGAIRNKVKDMPPFSDFLKDVLAASKTAEDAPLFPKGILEENTEDDEVARPEVKAIHSIGADSGIAVRKWLEGIYGGKDKVVWSDTLNSSGKEFGFEKVGPALSGSCCAWLCTSRAEGAIVEIRNADGGLVPLADWIEVGESFAEIFMRLNS